ncbi:MAG: glycosyltransferase [Promethearchaeota archaeon]
MIRIYFSNSSFSGGNIYNYEVYKTLKTHFKYCKKIYCHTNYNKIGETYINGIYSIFKERSDQGDIDIFDYTKSVWSSFRNKASRIIIFHHFDRYVANKPFKYKIYFNRFLKSARSATVVTVSEFWKNFLEENGIKNIKIIYNSFDISKYIPTLSRIEFLKKFKLPDKPIIYLGKNSKKKTKKAYELIKSLEKNNLIITTGKVKEFEGPICLDLNFKDYVNLLCHSSVTVLLPDFLEGWSRIAHESILCGTPVIGNGSGGMRELLEMTEQYILTYNHKDLILDKIKNIIISKERVKEEKIEKLRRFNTNYFNNEWVSLIKKIYKL